MVTLKTDLASFTGAGYGRLRVRPGSHLVVGETVAVTDDEADTFEADVLAVNGDIADIHVHWDRILRRA